MVNSDQLATILVLNQSKVTKWAMAPVPETALDGSKTKVLEHFFLAQAVEKHFSFQIRAAYHVRFLS